MGIQGREQGLCARNDVEWPVAWLSPRGARRPRCPHQTTNLKRPHQTLFGGAKTPGRSKKLQPQRQCTQLRQKTSARAQTRVSVPTMSGCFSEEGSPVETPVDLLLLRHPEVYHASSSCEFNMTSNGRPQPTVRNAVGTKYKIGVVETTCRALQSYRVSYPLGILPSGVSQNAHPSPPFVEGPSGGLPAV